VSLRLAVGLGECVGSTCCAAAHCDWLPLLINRAHIPAEEPLVYHNDAITIEGIKQLIQDGVVDCIVLSPGPGSPLVPQDVGASSGVRRRSGG